MLKVQNKATKTIRVIQIILFLILIYLTSQPFVWGGDQYFAELKGKTFTVLDMISYIGASGSHTSQLTTIGLCYIIFLVIPTVAVGFQIFDRQYNLKNVVGIICSFAGVMSIIYLVGAPYICFGSMVSLVLYLITAFLSVMGIFARFLKEAS